MVSKEDFLCDSLACAALHGFHRFSVSGLPDVASTSFRRRGEVWRLVSIDVLTRLDRSLKTGSQPWINLL
jgi:hypothetical protein